MSRRSASRGAKFAFEKIALNAVGARRALPRFPKCETVFALDQKKAARAAAAGLAQNLVCRAIRKNRVVGVAATGGEWRVAAGEEPEVAVTDDAHQERRHGVHIANGDESLAVDGQR